MWTNAKLMAAVLETKVYRVAAREDGVLVGRYAGHGPEWSAEVEADGKMVCSWCEGEWYRTTVENFLHALVDDRAETMVALSEGPAHLVLS